MAQITYTDKVALNENPNVADINKVNASDMNEIKNVVNTLIVGTQTTSDTNTYSTTYINDNFRNVTDISSLVTKTNNMGTLYTFSAYKKNNRCYLDVQCEVSAVGNIFTIDDSIKPTKDGFAISYNYSSSSGIPGYVKVTNNSSNIVLYVYGTLLPYLVFHLEWEV